MRLFHATIIILGTTPTLPTPTPPTTKPTSLLDPIPLLSVDPLYSSSTCSLSSIGGGSLSLPFTTLSTSTHILPSLLKHTTVTASTTTTGGTTKGKKGGRGSRSIKSVDVEPISLEGTVKTSSGKDKKVSVNVPSIEYPVSEGEGGGTGREEGWRGRENERVEGEGG